ncbi:MAG TPA: putative metallopeptidase [Spirochaetota bacterium]|nr:putative metallopeptidase [Spirochaetota bacterium]HRZ26074.1 putative metallopeptidase [Spirochaetota bacterium]HSA14695.1 putative metallopeptidase [Spirochaetota bacterium]
MDKIPSINLSDTLALMIHEAVRRYPSFGHIDLNRVQVCISSNRGGRGGIYGKLVPLKFKDGSPVVRHRGKIFRMPDIVMNGVPQLYIIYFYMPRFFDLPPEEKIRVIFHEMFHISGDFNGDIRRMAAVKSAHGHSRDRFDSHFRNEILDFCEYVRQTPFYNFLQLDSRGLKSRFNRITGARMKMPRPFAVR